MARRGPRVGGEDTRTGILEAARRLFAERGYDRTTIRAVAGDAGVDPALVHHYFGTKEGLFTASVSLPVDIVRAIPEAIADDPAGAGERIARIFLFVWEQEETRHALVGQLRHAFATDAQPAIAEFISRAVLHRVAAVLDGEKRELRAELVASHLLGIALLRYVVKMEPIASADPEQIVQMVAPRIQTYIT